MGRNPFLDCNKHRFSLQLNECKSFCVTSTYKLSAWDYMHSQANSVKSCKEGHEEGEF